MGLELHTVIVQLFCVMPVTVFIHWAHHIFFILLQKITVAECIETQSKAMTMLTVDQLSYLLKFALQKIKQPGVRAVNTLHSSSVGLHPKHSVSTHQRRWNAFWLVHLFSFSCWPDGTFSETSVSGAAPRLCRVHFPPYGPVHAREGNITRPKGPLKHEPPPPPSNHARISGNEKCLKKTTKEDEMMVIAINTALWIICYWRWCYVVW